MGSSARDPGKLFTNGKEIVEESVKRSQFALSVATGERFGLSPKSKNSFPAANPFHSLEYMGIPRRVVIDPAMNHDLRVAETEIPVSTHEYLRREIVVCEANIPVFPRSLDSVSSSAFSSGTV